MVKWFEINANWSKDDVWEGDSFLRVCLSVRMFVCYMFVCVRTQFKSWRHNGESQRRICSACSMLDVDDVNMTLSRRREELENGNCVASLRWDLESWRSHKSVYTSQAVSGTAAHLGSRQSDRKRVREAIYGRLRNTFSSKLRRRRESCEPRRRRATGPVDFCKERNYFPTQQRAKRCRGKCGTKRRFT